MTAARALPPAPDSGPRAVLHGIAGQRCDDGEPDRRALARCPRVAAPLRRYLRDELTAEERAAGDLRGLLGDLAAAQRATARAPARVSYPGRPAYTSPALGGVSGDLAAALREIPDRRSRVRAASGGT